MHSPVLRYIDHVARYGSIRRAAEALNVASTAVNRQILNLEREIGVPLFDRLKSGVRPTAAGECVIRHARKTQSEWETTLAEIASLSGDIHGEVKVIAIPAAIERLLPQAIEATMRTHPNITFRVIDIDPADQAEEMRAGRPDIAVLFVEKNYPEYDVIARLKLRMGAIMRPDHPLARSKELTLTDCAAYTVVLLDDPWMLDVAATHEFEASGAHFKAALRTNSLFLSKNTIKAGLAIGFFTPTGFIEEMKRGELVHVPLSEPDLAAFEIGLFIHSNRGNLPAIKAMAWKLVDEFIKLPDEAAALLSGDGGKK